MQPEVLRREPEASIQLTAVEDEQAGAGGQSGKIAAADGRKVTLVQPQLFINRHIVQQSAPLKNVVNCVAELEATEQGKYWEAKCGLPR